MEVSLTNGSTFLNSCTHRATSEINGVTYPPWDIADLSEFRSVSAPSEDYEDPVGLISLSSQQNAQLGEWMRPHEICDHPKMVHLISSFTIKQVGHCLNYFISSRGVGEGGAGGTVAPPHF